MIPTTKRILIAALVAVAVAFGAPVAAQASSLYGPGKFTFDAYEPVKKGGYVILSGTDTMKYYQTVEFYFKADGSSKWVYQNATRSSHGRYSRRQAQNHSGTWQAKVTCECDAIPTYGPSKTDHVALSGVQLPGLQPYWGNYYISYKPSTYNPSGDGSWYFTNLHWSRLSSLSATVTAIEHANNCIPDCADGHFSSRNVTIKFSSVKSWHGFPAFSKMVVSGRSGTTVILG